MSKLRSFMDFMNKAQVDSYAVRGASESNLAYTARASSGAIKEAGVFLGGGAAIGAGYGLVSGGDAKESALHGAGLGFSASTVAMLANKNLRGKTWYSSAANKLGAGVHTKNAVKASVVGSFAGGIAGYSMTGPSSPMGPTESIARGLGFNPDKNSKNTSSQMIGNDGRFAGAALGLAGSLGAAGALRLKRKMTSPTSAIRSAWGAITGRNKINETTSAFSQAIL